MVSCVMAIHPVQAHLGVPRQDTPWTEQVRRESIVGFIADAQPTLASQPTVARRAPKTEPSHLFRVLPRAIIASLHGNDQMAPSAVGCIN